VADDRVVLSKLFQQRGYETAGFVANLFYTAWDSEIDRGFAKYFDYPRTLEQTLRSSSLGQMRMIKRFYNEISLANVARFVARPDFYTNPKPSNSLKKAGPQTDQFLRWLDAREPRPFFAFMNYFDAHEPYDPPPPFRRAFTDDPKTRDLYDGGVAYMDREVSRIIDALRTRGLLDRTLVIVTSDHGELFGENGLTGHHSNLYFNVLHVPLIMRFPGHVPAGLRVSSPISLRDLAQTIADLTRLPEGDRIPGVSLARYWSGKQGEGSPLFAAVEKGVRVDSTLPFAKGDMVSIMDEQWHYIRNNGTSREELYRYREDPEEKVDYVKRAETDSVKARLRGRIADIQRSHGAPVPITPP
jgi:arylsulfatase A-like enzyme